MNYSCIFRNNLINDIKTMALLNQFIVQLINKQIQLVNKNAMLRTEIALLRKQYYKSLEGTVAAVTETSSSNTPSNGLPDNSCTVSLNLLDWDK